jgi:hypothetical protein
MIEELVDCEYDDDTIQLKLKQLERLSQDVQQTRNYTFRPLSVDPQLTLLIACRSCDKQCYVDDKIVDNYRSDIINSQLLQSVDLNTVCGHCSLPIENVNN